MGLMQLAEFTSIAQECRENQLKFEAFRQHPKVLSLGWPDEVLEQWLYDHADNDSFLEDYGAVNLSQIHWDVEAVSTDELAEMPTGLSDRGIIDEYTEKPSHWINVRKHGIHRGVALCWETHGTWKRWPLLIERVFIDPPAQGLQVIEGRTRVGVLKGRRREGSYVAKNHLAWVGRAVA